jgi:hypothetical protein
MDAGARGSRSKGGARRGLLAKVATPLAVAVALLAPPAAAQASTDVGVTQDVSTTVVKPGGDVTVDVTVTNLGDVPTPSGDVAVDLFSYREYARAADAPYRSFSTSSGSCSDQSAVAYGMLYHAVACHLGALGPGESAHIRAVIEVHDSLRHFANLEIDETNHDYYDEVNSNNRVADKIAEDVPPALTGSKKVVLKGLPQGCASGDFTLRATAKAPKVKKMQASLYLGEKLGDGQTWRKTHHGSHLVVKVPVSQINDPVLNQVFKLKVTAKLGGKALQRVVAFQLC